MSKVKVCFTCLNVLIYCLHWFLCNTIISQQSLVRCPFLYLHLMGIKKTVSNCTDSYQNKPANTIHFHFYKTYILLFLAFCTIKYYFIFTVALVSLSCWMLKSCCPILNDWLDKFSRCCSYLKKQITCIILIYKLYLFFLLMLYYKTK